MEILNLSPPSPFFVKSIPSLYTPNARICPFCDFRPRVEILFHYDTNTTNDPPFTFLFLSISPPPPHPTFYRKIIGLRTLKSEVIGKLLLWTSFMDQGVFFPFSNEGNESFILPEYPPVVLNETELTRPHPSTIHQVPITHEQPTHLPTTHTSSIHTPTPTIQKLKTTNHQRPTHLSLIHSSTHLTKIHYCTLTTFLYTQQPTNCLHTQPPTIHPHTNYSPLPTPKNYPFIRY